MRILVIGDGCTDVFQYGTCERICPEAPVPVFKPTTVKRSKGMAINVYKNIVELGADGKIISRDTSTKTRYIDEVSNQMLIRIDENDELENISLDVITKINFREYNAVIISDYNKGFLHEDDISYIAEKARELDIPTFLDTKKQIGSWVNQISVIKINKKERDENLYDFTDYYGYLIVTEGKNGATLYDQHEVKVYKFPIEDEHPVRDLSGAGDTFLAALAVEYLKNDGNIQEAIRFANKCASWVVTQKGVVPVKLNEVYK